MPHPNKRRGNLDLERKIEWKFLLLTLLLQPPSINGVKGRDLLPIVQHQMKQYDGGNWAGLIANYKHDVMLTHNIIWNNDRSLEEKEEAHKRKATDFSSRFQCSQSQARKHLQSNGLGNHTDPAIADQMTRKHPARKAPMTTLTYDEMQLPRKGIDCEVFLWEIRVLKADLAPGLSSLCHKHLLTLAVN
jgi:hypothetical protein